MFSWIGVPMVFIGVAVALLSILFFVRNNYIKCAPNEVLVFFGHRNKMKIGEETVERGYRLITGGGAFRVPMLEEVKSLPLSTFQVDVSTHDTPNKDGVLVSVDSVANLKISSDPAVLDAAVERLLDKSPEEIKRLCVSTLEGQQRQILGTLTIEDIIQEREKISHQVLAVTSAELAKLGFTLDNFVVQRIIDKQGYIEALGKKRTAQVKRDAAIGEAEAEREAKERSSEAKKMGEQARLIADEAIAEAERNLALKKSGFLAETEAKRVAAEMAGDIRKAEIDKDLRTKRKEAEAAEVTAGIQVAEQEAIRIKAHLDATTIQQAEAAKRAAILKADGEAQAVERTAEANKKRIQLEGEGQAAAEAARKKEVGVAEATVREAQGMAEGAAIAARLTAEAEGLEKKNKALAQLSDSARLIIILEHLPKVIAETGEAGEKIVGAAFEHIGAGLSRIDNLTMVDMGSGNGHDSPVVRFAGAIPEIVFQTITKARAMGIDLDDLFHALGIDPSKLIGSIPPPTDTHGAGADHTEAGVS